MDIIYIICAILFGALTMFLVTKLIATTNNTVPEEGSTSEKNKLSDELNAAKQEIEHLHKELENVYKGNIDESIQKQLANISKLKKEISDLEDEIEELEDSNNENKKKLGIRTEELNKQQDKVRQLEKELKLVHEDIEHVKSELQEKTDSLALTSESLSFVQEVLSAKQTNDKTTKELYEKVDRIVNVISEDLKDEFKEFIGIEQYPLFDKEIGELAQWAITEKKSWIKGKTSIAFVGEFSAGKTSIVNRILSQDDKNVPKLPVSMKATTAIPTYISGGIGTFYRFVTPDNILKEISKETFNRVNKEVLDQVKGVSSLIQYFVMTYKNANLNGLSILDTPGFASNDKEDAGRTLEVINECDALFWVVDVNVGTTNRSSIELIKNNLKKPLYIVINKIDTKAERDVNAVEQLTKKTLHDEGLKVEKIIRFSEKSPLEDIMRPIKELASNVTKYEYFEKIDTFLQQCLKQVKNECNIANKNYRESTLQSNEITEKYNESVNKMANNCNEVARIPQWNTHFFSKDCFEMSEQQYNRLCNLLNTICSTRINELYDLYNNQREITADIQKEQSKKIELINKYNRMNSARNTFIRLINELNN